MRTTWLLRKVSRLGGSIQFHVCLLKRLPFENKAFVQKNDKTKKNPWVQLPFFAPHGLIDLGLAEGDTPDVEERPGDGEEGQGLTQNGADVFF